MSSLTKEIPFLKSIDQIVIILTRWMYVYLEKRKNGYEHHPS
ncbi:hypothetical protein [Paenibacillus gallinarum]|nr:hypothetical protein [Paenibacillus gallinarum]